MSIRKSFMIANAAFASAFSVNASRTSFDSSLTVGRWLGINGLRLFLQFWMLDVECYSNRLIVMNGRLLKLIKASGPKRLHLICNEMNRYSL